MLDLVLVLQDNAKPVVRLGTVGVDSNSQLETLPGLLVFVLTEAQVAEVDVGHREIGFQLESLAKMGLGSIRLSKRVKCNTQSIMSAGVIWPKTQSMLEAGHRLFKLALPCAGNAHLAERFHVVRPQAEHGFIGGHGLRHLIRRFVNKSPMVRVFRHAWIQGQRPLN